MWSEITPASAHFEQSFSDDGGKTWEVNWITDQTRVGEDLDAAQSQAAPPKRDLQSPTPGRDGQRDFDFEFGSWKAHLKRLRHPLTGSPNWIEYDGTSVVKKHWFGNGNAGELALDSGAAHIEGLTLRLYNSQTHQWRLYWANSKEGILNVPAIGEFQDGRGDFYDQEDFNGRRSWSTSSFQT